MKPRRITADDTLTLELGYYWVNRPETSGAGWEIAELRQQSFGPRGWYICGSQYPLSPTMNRNASSGWQLGPRLEPPA